MASCFYNQVAQVHFSDSTWNIFGLWTKQYISECHDGLLERHFSQFSEIL